MILNVSLQLLVSYVIKQAVYAWKLLFVDTVRSSSDENEQASQECAPAADSVQCSG